MAYDFNRNFGQGAYGQGSRLGFQGGGAVPPMRPLAPYPPAQAMQQLVPYPPAILAQGFQRGGRVGRALARAGAGTAGLRNQMAMEDALEALTAAKDKATGWWDTAGKWIGGAGDVAKIASSFIPGVGPLISTAIGAGVEGLGTVIADEWAPDVVTPQDIINRQTGAGGTGPVIGRRNWEKMQEAYGDLSDFSRSAGRKMRAGIASSLPADYLKAKTADMMMKGLKGNGGHDPTFDYTSLEGSGMSPGAYDNLVAGRQASWQAANPTWDPDTSTFTDFWGDEPSLWDKFTDNFRPGGNLSFGKLGQ